MNRTGELLADLFAKARADLRSVVLPEGNDARVLHAAARLSKDKLARPILLGTPASVRHAAADAGVDINGIEIADPRTDVRAPAYASALAARRKKLSEAETLKLMTDPLYFAGMMVREGDAAAMVAGAATTTADVIKAGLTTVGVAEGVTLASSYFLMVIPDFLGGGPKRFVFADGAVNPEPTAEDLASIAVASARSAAKVLSETPRVALLSFSTHGSAQHPLVDKVREALSIARERAPSLLIDGEFQLDAAVVREVAARKVKGESEVAGRANVLIFPDLQSANIGYKLTQWLGGAVAVGPFLQGFAKPVSDLSRGASTDDIVTTCAVTLATG